jgi:hypothetical protein
VVPFFVDLLYHKSWQRLSPVADAHSRQAAGTGESWRSGAIRQMLIYSQGRIAAWFN